MILALPEGFIQLTGFVRRSHMPKSHPTCHHLIIIEQIASFAFGIGIAEHARSHRHLKQKTGRATHSV